MKKVILTIVVSIIISNCFIYITKDYAPIADKYKFSKMNLGSELSQNLGEITSGIEIRQSYVAKNDNLLGLTIFVSTFNRNNTGNMIVKILDGDGVDVLRTIQINYSELKDNQYHEIKFPVLKETKDKVFIISITSDSVETNNAVTIWKDQKQFENTLLFSNGKIISGTLVGDLIYENIIDLKTRVIINFVVLTLNLLALKLFLFLKRR
jgi:hypothetical protein